MKNTNLPAFLATFLCIIFSVHAAITLNAGVGFFGFFILLSYFCAIGIVWRNVKNPSKSAAGTAALIAAGCIALQYFLLLSANPINGQFIIGDSDSKLYHNIAETISINFKLFDQITSFSHVKEAADISGYIVPNFGMFWFLGVIYSVFGIECGPGIYLLINVVCAMVIAYFSVLIAGLYSNKGISKYTATLFSLLIFMNFSISEHAFHLRKDFLLVALLMVSIYYGIMGRWILFLLFGFLTVQLRSIFLLVLIIPVFFLIIKNTSIIWKISLKLILIFVIVSVVVLSNLPQSIYLLFGLISNDNDLTTLSGLYGTANGSAILVKNGLLQWVYIIFYPFPSLSAATYITTDGWISLSVFCINFYLFFGIFKTQIQTSSNDNRYALLFSVLGVLFLLLLINLVTAAATGSFGVVEPRYKFAWWVFSGIVMMAYKSNKGYLKMRGNT
ncbi:hypothetical protein RGU75_05335 [Glaciimonas sp. CA11.2]|uniref:hypothetical protein n=1 Tax=Glaciimonas sp. CA11.2 TaxID=3048601 RepID=UPI002AB58AE6|nr:hypothetical protein [Glaciimonas sp. CA11.2]MDY7545654.1 hypothetical protein [Glaciimonas sp. CA11.2]